MNKFLRSYGIELIVFSLFIVYAGMLNLQFLEGSNVNFTFSGHDEYLTVREVYSILNPASFKHFALAVSAGDVMFYGRAMFYTDAFLAWLPFKMFGLTGMVYAIRMAHVLYLIIAIILLGRTFLGKPLYKVLFYSAILTWYYTAYFVMVPKPEPLQLLVLAVFLFYAKKNEWNYGKHFIWLGIAYGLKFNVLMILPVFFGAPFFTSSFKIKEAIISGLWLVLGIIIAVPSLLLSPLRPIYLKTYLRSTFGNTSHYDDTGVPFGDWLNKGLFQWYGGHTFIGAIIFVAFIGIVAWLAYRLLIKKELNATVIISAMAFCFLIPVMLLTKRLWPHYLWTGSLLMALSVLMFLDSLPYQNVISKISSYLLTICLIIISILSIKKIQPLFILENKFSNEIINGKRAHSYLSHKTSKFNCLQDISVYLPFKDFVSSYRYHPFSSSYPYSIIHQKYCWSKSGFINPETIEEVKADYIITNRTNFEIVNAQQNSSKNKIIEKYNEQMRSLLNNTLFLDTVIGDVRIYKMRNDTVN